MKDNYWYLIRLLCKNTFHKAIHSNCIIRLGVILINVPKITLRFQKNFPLNVIPPIEEYQDYGIGFGYHVVLKINQKKDSAYVGIYFDRIALYDDKKESIEKELQAKLMWKRELPKGAAYLVLERIQIADRIGWNRAAQWMMGYAVTIKHVFRKMESYVE